MRPDLRQLRRVQWLPPLRLTLRLAPPPATMSPELRHQLDRAHLRRRVMVGALSAVAVAAVSAGSVPGATASAGVGDTAGNTARNTALDVGGGARLEWTPAGWVMVTGERVKDRGSLPEGLGAPGIDASDITDLGIPDVALDAYRSAAVALADEEADPDCRIGWPLLAGIGKVESSHGQFGGRRPGVDGSVAPPIIGIPLDGRPGVALIRDTDGGRLDFDTVYDRAVGPMQFIPGTWAAFPDADGDGNGTVDPHNLYDAALAAGSYLCSGPGDLSTAGDQRSAVKRYNNSDSYADLVLAYAAAYQAGVNPTGPEPTPGGPPPTVPKDPVTDPVHPPTSPPPPTSGPPTTTPPPTTPPTTTPPTTAPPTTTPPTTTPPTSGPPTSGPPTGEPPSCTPPPTTEPPTSGPPTSEPPSCTSPPPTTEPPTSSAPGSSDPGSSAPGTSDPGSSDPGSSAPGTSDPGSSAPVASEPSSPTTI